MLSNHEDEKMQAGYSCIIALFCVMVLLFTPTYVFAEENLQAVVLVPHGNQIFAFSSICNCWDSVDLGGQERVLEYKSGALLSVAVTNLRVLGFSAETGKWDQIKLKGNEQFLLLEAKGTVAAVKTNIRVLGFGSTKGKWVETFFHIN